MIRYDLLRSTTICYDVHQSLDLIEQFVPETPRLNRIRLNRDYCYVVMRSKV